MLSCIYIRMCQSVKNVEQIGADIILWNLFDFTIKIKELVENLKASMFSDFHFFPEKH